MPYYVVSLTGNKRRRKIVIIEKAMKRLLVSLDKY